MIVALLPAHNEAGSVAAAVASLLDQTRPPDRIIVVTDNCTDETAAAALSAGAEVWATTANTAKKAGALNQRLATLLPALDADDAVLVMDADSVVSAGFLRTATDRLAADPRVGAVGGIFLGDDGGGLVGALQRNEYARYARDVARKKGRAMVLTGTATLFRVHVLREVAAARGEGLPGVPGRVYDTAALTEDNEITLAVKTLGYRAVSPKDCLVTTEVMQTWGDLWRQRLRWQRGALENLHHYRLSRVTLPYVGQQVGMAVGLVAMWAYLAFTAAIVAAGAFSFSPLWAAIGLVFVAERVVTVWRRGRGARLLAAVLLPEMAYDVFQQAVLVRAVVDALLRRDAAWHHPPHHPLAIEEGR